MNRKLKEKIFARACLFSTVFMIIMFVSSMTFIIINAMPAFFVTKIHHTKENEHITQKIERNGKVKGKFDYYYKHKLRSDPEYNSMILELEKSGDIDTEFNKDFFTNPDSSRSEDAGMLSSIVSTLYMFVIYFFSVLVLGTCSGMFVAEYISSTKIKDLIELYLKSIVGLPSVIFGMIGLHFFVFMLGLGRSTILVGALTISLMILPVVILTTKQAFDAIPQVLRDSAVAFGATKTEVCFKILLPVAFPRVLTGIIVAVLRAMGETAPLIMVGMATFAPYVPSGFFDFGTGIPVQIYLWINDPQNSFVEKSAGAILVLMLLIFLSGIVMGFVRSRIRTFR